MCGGEEGRLLTWDIRNLRSVGAVLQCVSLKEREIERNMHCSAMTVATLQQYHITECLPYSLYCDQSLSCQWPHPPRGIWLVYCLFSNRCTTKQLLTLSPSSADGATILWRLDEPFAPVSKLTGPDIDHVTSIRIHGDTVYTSCRDGCIRVYSTSDIIPLS